MAQPPQEGPGLALIGAGKWGKNLVRGFDRVWGARLRVVCDLVEENRDHAATLSPGVWTTNSVDRALAYPGIEAVALATDAGHHFAIGLRVLRAGKHLFVEKPLALTHREAQGLVDAAKEQRRSLMVGHLMLFHPAIRWIRQRLAAGDLGAPLRVLCQRFDRVASPGEPSAWWAFAPHDLSILPFLLGAEPLSMGAQGVCYLWDRSSDVSSASLRFPDGVRAEVQTSWLAPRKTRRLTLVCSEKVVVFDDVEPVDKLKLYERRGDDLEGSLDEIGARPARWVPRLPPLEPLQLECQHFVDCLRSGEPPLTSGAQGAAVVRMLRAGELSMRRGGVTIDLSPSACS